jgi:hypothetical protein
MVGFMKSIAALRLFLPLACFATAGAGEPAGLVRSSRSGRWSDAATWAGGRTPGPQARIQVRSGHVVTYDMKSDAAVRSIHVAGTLRFDPDRDTRLDVGLIKIQAGDDASESGFDCESHAADRAVQRDQPSLEIGTPFHPISRDHIALIRLTFIPGLDPVECPAIVCCGGRMDLHGAELTRTWVKLGATAAAASRTVILAEDVAGWRVGDRIIITATHRQTVPDEGKVSSVRARPETEERTIRAIDGPRITLDAPLAFNHLGADLHRGEVANLSRNVIVESADPAGNRGHTMYHRNSSGSISYAEFRHLGKAGKLGKYSLHFHRVADTMRGTSVVGASIWDSANRWITIHGTNSLCVRDCVGYSSIGHGFFLEDGTEVDNILDRNLAVQASAGSPLEKQILPFDRNEGAGFWWANSRNAFMRNVAVECDQYGFRYEAPKEAGFDGVLPVRGSDQIVRPVDIRTLPFLRFDDNEAHAQRRYGLNLGGGPGNGAVGGVGDAGPDKRHPFAIKGLRVWDAHWAVALAAPRVLIDGLDIAYCDFGLWRPRYLNHAYRNLKLYQVFWAFYDESGERPDPGAFPAPLQPVDDRPPVTVITRVRPLEHGRLLVQGASADDGTVKCVKINGITARPVCPDFSQWEVELADLAPGPVPLCATAEDAAGNVEPNPHRAAAMVR